MSGLLAIMAGGVIAWTPVPQVPCDSAKAAAAADLVATFNREAIAGGLGTVIDWRGMEPGKGLRDTYVAPGLWAAMDARTKEITARSIGYWLNCTEIPRATEGEVHPSPREEVKIFDLQSGQLLASVSFWGRFRVEGRRERPVWPSKGVSRRGVFATAALLALAAPAAAGKADTTR